jgi:hypothetical protein
MSRTLESDRKKIEEAVADPKNRKFLEKFVCKVIKIGVKIPDFETILRIYADLSKDPDKDVCFDRVEAGVADTILAGVCYLCQLSLTKERM